MPQSEEAAAWFQAVYETVQQIPHGKVTSYGHIALLLDHRKWGMDNVASALYCFANACASVQPSVPGWYHRFCRFYIP